jgi:hypothetical protein
MAQLKGGTTISGYLALHTGNLDTVPTPAGGTSTQIQYNSGGSLAGFGANNTYTIDLSKPLVLEPWSGHASATGIGCIAYGDENRPEVIMNVNGHSQRNSFEGQFPNNTYKNGFTATASFTLDWGYGGCASIVLSTTNITITVDNVPDGASGTILVKQSSTTARTITMAGTSPYTTLQTIGSNSAIKTTLNSYSTITFKRFGTILVLVYGHG